MAISAYGKSVKSYSAWTEATEYAQGVFCVPTEDNGFCYEATTGGTSDTDAEGDPAVEPVWPNVIGETVADGSVVWTCREKEEEANPLSVSLSLKDTGGYSLKDIWVASPGDAVFYVYGSCDGVNWRLLDTITLPAGELHNDHLSMQNAYPYIAVGTAAEAVNEIEIVANQT